MNRGLAVRARRIRAGAEMSEVQGLAGAPEDAGHIAAPVVALITRRTDVPRAANQATLRCRNAAQVEPSWSASTST